MEASRTALAATIQQLHQVTDQVSAQGTCSRAQCMCADQVPWVIRKLEQQAQAYAQLSCADDLWQQIQQVLARLACVFFRDSHRANAV